MTRSPGTIPDTIDKIALSSPDKTWIRYATSSEALKDNCLTPITFGALANAVNRLAWHLKDSLPQTEELETTICYIGPSDIRYFIIACAATKCRIKVLLSSPRNNLTAHQALFQQTQCRTLIGPLACCESLRDDCKMNYIGIPELDELLSLSSVEAFPWRRTFDEVSHEPFVILHTSGSTGQPKPIEVSHALIATIEAQQDLPDIGGRCITSRMWKDRTLYAAMPLFHSAAFNTLAFSIFQGTQLVLGPSDQPPSVSTVECVLDSSYAEAGLIPPSLLAEISKDEVVLPKLAQWESVAFGGGPLDEEAAKIIWKHTKILPLVGSTETFNLSELVPEAEDEVQYHNFHPHLGIRFEEVSDGLYELVFVRSAEHARHQGAFCTFPGQDEFRMKDMYEKHCSKPGLWRYKGRLDDVIVLSNGEKLNPREAEDILSTHQDIESALIVGAGREQPLLLVETKNAISVETGLELSKELESANDVLPAYGQIHPTHVCLLEPESFLRSGKGEVRRLPTIDALRARIDDTYAAAEHNETSDTQLNFSTTQDLVSSLSLVVTSEIMSGQTLEATDNIFNYGVDSLDVLRLTRSIKCSMEAQHLNGADKISPQVIYNQRTLANIADSLINIGNVEEDNSEQPEHEMQQTLETYLAKLPESATTCASKSASSQQVFLLTGSTGSLGSYLLDTLLRAHAQAKIICLNRPGSDASRQVKIQRERGLATDFSRVDFVEGHISKERFGLDLGSYQRLQQATHIVHNAWSVNWNLPLSAFEDQLMGCCRLITLASSSVHDIGITFLSSVGAANRWAQEGFSGPVPEAKLEHLAVAEPTGYARSKLLAEQIFSEASKRLQLSVAICRLGQIAGPVNSTKGMWSTQEWFPSIILSANKMRRLPNSLAAMNLVDWIPVDLLAVMLTNTINGGVSGSAHCDGQTPEKGTSVHSTFSIPYADNSSSDVSSIAEVISESASIDTPASSVPQSPEGPHVMSSSLMFLHFVNPRSVDWRDLAPSVAKLLGDDVQLVSFDEWLEGLSASLGQHDSVHGEDELPAAKLIDFLRDIACGSGARSEFSVEESLKASEDLRSLQPISYESLEHWWHQWSIMLN
nr:non-canonical non-ribosomal peptide synthetase fub8 [Quercus suber]